MPGLVWNVIHKGVYHDSVILMQLTRDLQVIDGVCRAAVMMGTPANRASYARQDYSHRMVMPRHLTI